MAVTCRSAPHKSLSLHVAEHSDLSIWQLPGAPPPTEGSRGLKHGPTTEFYSVRAVIDGEWTSIDLAYAFRSTFLGTDIGPSVQVVRHESLCCLASEGAHISVRCTDLILCLFRSHMFAVCITACCKWRSSAKADPIGFTRVDNLPDCSC
jgi:hypothetical protein